MGTPTIVASNAERGHKDADIQGGGGAIFAQ